jgi:hypothetical protein
MAPTLPSGSAMFDLHAACPLQQRHEVGDGVLPPVDLAILQGAAAVPGSGIVIHSTRSTSMRLPPASQSALPRRGIAGEALEHRAGARDPFVALEGHRAGADIFRDAARGVGLRDALRHDHQQRRVALAQA